MDKNSEEEQIRRQMSQPLSDEQIQYLIPQGVRIIRYGVMDKFVTLDQVLDPYGVTLILFETSTNNNQTNGHWTVLLRTIDDDSNPSINFFDSYGIIPDDEKRYINPTFQKVIGNSQNYLSKLLLEAKKATDEVIEYNQVKFQKMAQDISTCGRHCALRVLLRELSLNEYQLFMKKLMDRFKRPYDEIVTIITQPVLEGQINSRELYKFLNDLI